MNIIWRIAECAGLVIGLILVVEAMLHARCATQGHGPWFRSDGEGWMQCRGCGKIVSDADEAPRH
jgi:hypothetical protein